MNPERKIKYRGKWGEIRPETEYLFLHPEAQIGTWINLIRDAARNPERFSIKSKIAMVHLITDTLSFLPLNKFDENYWRTLDMLADGEQNRQGNKGDPLVLKGCSRIKLIATVKMSEWDIKYLEARLWKEKGCRSNDADELLRRLRKLFPKVKYLWQTEPPKAWIERKLREEKKKKKRV